LPISPLGSRPMSQACQLTHWHANGVTHWPLACQRHWHASTERLTPLACQWLISYMIGMPKD